MCWVIFLDHSIFLKILWPISFLSLMWHFVSLFNTFSLILWVSRAWEICVFLFGSQYLLQCLSWQVLPECLEGLLEIHTVSEAECHRPRLSRWKAYTQKCLQLEIINTCLPQLPVSEAVIMAPSGFLQSWSPVVRAPWCSKAMEQRMESELPCQKEDSLHLSNMVEKRAMQSTDNYLFLQDWILCHQMKIRMDWKPLHLSEEIFVEQS